MLKSKSLPAVIMSFASATLLQCAKTEQDLKNLLLKYPEAYESLQTPLMNL